MSGNVPRFPIENFGVFEDPLTLQNIALHYLSKNLNLISDQDGGYLRLKDDIMIQNAICDQFLEKCQRFHTNSDDRIISLFRNTERTPLRNIHLRNSRLTNLGIEMLLQHKLHSLSLWYCDQITLESYQLIGNRGESLHSLELGFGRHVQNQRQIDFHLNCPNLNHLTLSNIILHPGIRFAHLQQMMYLDLTSCNLTNFNLQELSSLPNLRILKLFEIWPMANHINSICQMSNLNALDISINSFGNGRGTYDHPDETLAKIIRNLKQLTYLDISGTNLAGNDANGIPGLQERRQRPLKYLGLFDTAHLACRRANIPAIEIAGDFNERQLVTAARIIDQPGVLIKVFARLYQFVLSNECTEIPTILEAVLSGLDRHVKFRNLFWNGSLIIHEILEKIPENEIGTSLKNYIIRVMIFGMEMFINDNEILHKGLLLLRLHKIPDDVIFEHERLLGVILHGISRVTHGSQAQRIAIRLLYDLCFHVEFRNKLTNNGSDVVRALMSLIRFSNIQNVFDDNIQLAWTTMWEIVFMNPNNGQLFLELNGLEHVFRCMEACPINECLIDICLLPLLWVTESWMVFLMRRDFVDILTRVANPYHRGFEVSNWAAGILAQLVSINIEPYPIEGLTRVDLHLFLNGIIMTWDLGSQRNYHLDSLEIILIFVSRSDMPMAQYWAIWTLANLTTVYPGIYCQLLRQGNAIELLNEVIRNLEPSNIIRQRAQQVIDNCNQ